MYNCTHNYTFNFMPFLKKFVLILITLLPLTSQAQTGKFLTVEGTVINARTLEPIPFANIGILYTEVGTLSNEDGSFSVKIRKSYMNQELIFSSIGYQQISISLDTIDASKPLKIALTELVTKLDEVKVTTEKFKEQKKVLGNVSGLLSDGYIVADTVYAGSAVALLIDKRQYPDLDYIHGASLRIEVNKMPSYKIRMRLLAVDSVNGSKPGKDILLEQILVESSLRKGWLKFPLEKIHQIKADVFYLTFEWILDKEDRKYIYDTYERYFEENPEQIRYDTLIVDDEVMISRRLPGTAGTFFGVTKSKKALTTHLCYSRAHSFGEWKRISSILSAKITLTNYP